MPSGCSRASATSSESRGRRRGATAAAPPAGAGSHAATRRATRRSAQSSSAAPDGSARVRIELAPLCELGHAALVELSQLADDRRVLGFDPNLLAPLFPTQLLLLRHRLPQATCESSASRRRDQPVRR